MRSKIQPETRLNAPRHLVSLLVSWLVLRNAHIIAIRLSTLVEGLTDQLGLEGHVVARQRLTIALQAVACRVEPLLAVDQSDPLAPGAATIGSVTITVPAGTAPGYYYVIGKADASAAVAEVSETNNAFQQVIRVN